MMFKIRCKSHYMWHVAFEVGVLKINPNLFHTFQEESFLGKIKQIGVKCHGRSCCHRLFQRYFLCLALFLEECRKAETEWATSDVEQNVFPIHWFTFLLFGCHSLGLGHGPKKGHVIETWNMWGRASRTDASISDDRRKPVWQVQSCWLNVLFATLVFLSLVFPIFLLCCRSLLVCNWVLHHNDTTERGNWRYSMFANKPVPPSTAKSLRDTNRGWIRTACLFTFFAERAPKILRDKCWKKHYDWKPFFPIIPVGCLKLEATTVENNTSYLKLVSPRIETRDVNFWGHGLEKHVGKPVSPMFENRSIAR